MKHHQGSVEVIIGSMFSGKTEELLRRLRRATIANQKVQVFKPIIDDRYGLEQVTSHDGNAYQARPIKSSADIQSQLHEDTTVVGIDEAQFFDEGISDVANLLAKNGIRVIVGGLDMDFRGEPFGPIPRIMAQADKVDKIHAICVICGNEAYCTQRLVDGKPAHYEDPVVIVGAKEMYEARCRKCHDVPRN